MGCILAIDVGGTYVKSASIDGESITRLCRIPTPHESMDAFLEAIKSLCDQLPQNDGIALCCSGIIDEKSGFMYTGGTLEYIHNTDMVQLIRNKCGGIPVSIVNDAKAAAKAELECGALQNVSEGIVLTIGTAIGGALIHERRVISGSHHFAGEFSYMNLDCLNQEEPFTFWGKLGCSKLSVSYMEKTGLDLSPEEIIDQAAEGDSAAQDAVKSYCALLAPAIVNLQCLTDPEIIAIGGAISERPFFIEMMKQQTTCYWETCNRLARGIPPVHLEACRFNDNVIGAYLCFAEKYNV